MASWWSRGGMPTCSSRMGCTRDCTRGSLRPPTSWRPRLSRKGGIDVGYNTGLHAPRANSQSKAENQGLRGVSEDGGHLGSPAFVRGLRPCRLLRLVEEQARDLTLPRHQPSDRQVARARRELDVLLHRRRDVRGRLGRAPAEEHPAIAAHVERGGLKSSGLEQPQDALNRQGAIAIDREPFQVARPIGRVRSLPLTLAKPVEGRVERLRRDRQAIDDEEPSAGSQVLEGPPNRAAILGFIEVV